MSITTLKLTDLGGNEIYFNVESIIVVRGVLHDESKTNAHAALVTYGGLFFVQETVTTVLEKIGVVSG